MQEPFTQGPCCRLAKPEHPTSTCLLALHRLSLQRHLPLGFRIQCHVPAFPNHLPHSLERGTLRDAASSISCRRHSHHLLHTAEHELHIGAATRTTHVPLQPQLSIPWAPNLILASLSTHSSQWRSGALFHAQSPGASAPFQFHTILPFQSTRMVAAIMVPSQPCGTTARTLRTFVQTPPPRKGVHSSAWTRW